jgi:acyl transferase domain-containing protein
MEAHGTGTPAGDAAEVTALHQVFGEAARSAFPWCALGSLKSQFGHTKSAAGAAGLLKAVLALHHKVLPPTIKVTRPSQSLRRPGSPFEVNTVVRPWIRGSAHPRRASVSSFGFGGTNFHVTAEEYVPRNGGRRPYRTRTAPSELVPLVAVSAEGVVDMCHAIAADHRPLAPVAREAQSRLGPGRRSDPPGHRLAIVAADTADLHRKAQQAAARLRTDPLTPFSTPDGVHYRTGPACRGRVAFLFPGQGSQYVGMGADLAMHVPAARTVWDRLADVELGDLPLHRVVFPAPPFSSGERDAQTALLTATEWAQPAVAAHSMALMAVLDALGVQPDCVAGHSLGELTALHAAGALDAGSLLRLTRLRGRLMRDAAREPGGMLAVRAPARDVEQAIRATGRRDLWIANRNAPEQVVVSGGARSLAVLQRRLDERGIPARPLPVSAAFHSPLVRSAARPLLDHVRDLPFAPLKTVVYGNADAAPYPSDTDELPERLARQLVSPVLFADQVAAMYEDGVRVFVEVGPGSVLTGLVGANLGKREHLAIALDRQGKDGLTALHQGLAALVAHGVPLDCTPLWHDHAATPPAGPPNSRATVLICGTNYGKPYPPAAAQEIAPPSPEPEPDDRPGPDAEVPNQPEVSPAMPQPAHGPSRRPPAGPQSPHGSPNGETAWIETLLEVHRLAAEAHTAYQRATADAHLAYLAAVDRSLNPAEAPPPVNRAAERDPAPVPPPAAMEPAPMMPPPEPVQPDQPAQDDVFDADTKFSGFSRFSDHSDHSGYSDHSQFSEFSEPVPSLSEPAAGAAQTSPTPAPVSPASVSPTPANGSPPGNGRSADDLTALTLEVVAEKTGFPVEILTPQMHLQADLGVDSIKRVEVLSALRDRIEGLPSLDAAELGRLQTIGEITDRLAVEAGG